MAALAHDLRRQLENVIIQARDKAEDAARSALQKRAVDVAEPFTHFGPKERELRNRLRARGRQVGDVRFPNGTQSIDQLTQELAYEFWHRMLFARYLAENNLLIHPDDRVSVSLEECEAEAANANPPAANGFVLAARYASKMLPRIFRTDDVLLEIDFAPEHRLKLETLVGTLPSKTFLADDSLGWVYQFWQAKKKDEVNSSGDKIDGRTISAVTQLFTEPYMVQFLLHNTIGAWWCARHDVHGPAGGAGVPAGRAPVAMEYLRWRDDGSPAAGSFSGWPKTFAEFTLLDPCCGSGHFLVSSFNLLVPLRMHDDKLSARDACDAVLRENLHGLELDPRCTQIAAFALALAAWKYPGENGEPLGYRELPPLNIACSGQGVAGKKDDWIKLANGDTTLRNGMERLYELFERAPHLGSLIDPRRQDGDLFHARHADLDTLLKKALAKNAQDADLSSVGVAAQGITAAADLLARQYTLVVTNVPYLGRGKQGDVLKEYIETHYAIAKADLATAFVMRCLELATDGTRMEHGLKQDFISDPCSIRVPSVAQCSGTVALVTPQNWLFLTSYKKLREDLLKRRQWNFMASLGEEAWWSFGIRGPRTVLLGLTVTTPATGSTFFGIDVSTNRGEPIIPLEEKAERLANRVPTPVQVVKQAGQVKNPDSRITLDDVASDTRLEESVICRLGLGTGDSPHYLRQFWEAPRVDGYWRRYQTGTNATGTFSGYESIVAWNENEQRVHGMTEEERATAHNQDYRGREVWGKMGIAIALMGELRTSIYTGERYDKSITVLLPHQKSTLPALWAFCTDPEFVASVRAIDQNAMCSSGAIPKIPFDLAHWQAVAAEKYPNGLPEPHSDDPTQWLFKGDIATSTDPLQVAVARLLGYRWPEQPTTLDAIDKLADSDGIVCLPGVRGEAAAAERLLEVLKAAFEPRMEHGSNTDNNQIHSSDPCTIRVPSVAKNFDAWLLLQKAGCKAGTTLDDWLRNQFFEQHCKRFHNRPFIWHIWDGRKDGFAALVNYHKLTHKTLENLTYSYLGDWITAQRKSDSAGADLRLAAAQALQEKLKLILAGAPPYDIFVRWKPLHEQAIGWHPDLNDGVRMNIRPFVEAEILRKTPNIKWTKDRGKEPERDKDDYPWFNAAGDRVNDVHLSNAVKQAARDRIAAKENQP